MLDISEKASPSAILSQVSVGRAREASGSLSPLIFTLKLPLRDAALGPHPFPRTGFLMV